MDLLETSTWRAVPKDPNPAPIPGHLKVSGPLCLNCFKAQTVSWYRIVLCV